MSDPNYHIGAERFLMAAADIVHRDGSQFVLMRREGSTTILPIFVIDRITMNWKKGRGNLGPMAPLLGNWVATADSPMGKVKCRRSFKLMLGGKYVQLTCTWQFAKSAYEEIAFFGAADGALAFWSFTSDGKRSNGVRTSAPDIHPDALCFEAEMPAGVARQVYWPNELGGFDWVVESKTKKGWNRFVLHRYVAVEEE